MEQKMEDNFMLAVIGIAFGVGVILSALAFYLEDQAGTIPEGCDIGHETVAGDYETNDTEFNVITSLACEKVDCYYYNHRPYQDKGSGTIETRCVE